MKKENLVNLLRGIQTGEVNIETALKNLQSRRVGRQPVVNYSVYQDASNELQSNPVFSGSSSVDKRARMILNLAQKKNPDVEFPLPATVSKLIKNETIKTGPFPAKKKKVAVEVVTENAVESSTVVVSEGIQTRPKKK